MAGNDPPSREEALKAPCHPRQSLHTRRKWARSRRFGNALTYRRYGAWSGSLSTNEEAAGKLSRGFLSLDDEELLEVHIAHAAHATHAATRRGRHRLLFGPLGDHRFGGDEQ